ncbi:hypothetical protein [Dysgonomonas sp. BGC7]|uniref:hypothetical protein n=1 Tax=Dysgonomonas sp. BGC7 TaxID=1658008 RepID=UPI000A87E894|nr:hypothetical protein [Dysgonomonas sp. BGC7]MBD8390373.1 hypothetical protein [Dysgonomonas sp. BGC7]
MEPVLLFLSVLVIVVIIVLLVFVSEMAITKGRSTIGWIILSLLLSPILCIVLLACLGETEEKRRERILKDQDYLRVWRDDD